LNANLLSSPIFSSNYFQSICQKQSPVTFCNCPWIAKTNGYIYKRVFLFAVISVFCYILVLTFTDIWHCWYLFFRNIISLKKIDIYIYVLMSQNPTSLDRQTRMRFERTYHKCERSRVEIRSMYRHAPAIIRDVRLRPCFKFQTAVQVYFLNLYEIGSAGKLKDIASGREQNRAIDYRT